MSAAAARVTDQSQCPADAHGCPGCPHGVIGPAIVGSGNVNIENKAALRAQGVDSGVHAVCCGPNTWRTDKGSSTVNINGSPAVRVGDATRHCGGVGQMVSGASKVFIGG
jgi:uncharacterized Zn-binding protein involved in type VI secretion